MFFGYMIFVLFWFVTIKGIIKTIKTKNMSDMFICLLSLLFSFGFFIGILLGGSALHNAANDYELYQEGRYYLVNHGQWTEVSYEKYLFVLVSEIVGLMSFVISFVLNMFRLFSVKE